MVTCDRLQVLLFLKLFKTGLCYGIEQALSVSWLVEALSWFKNWYSIFSRQISNDFDSVHEQVFRIFNREWNHGIDKN